MSHGYLDVKTGGSLALQRLTSLMAISCQSLQFYETKDLFIIAYLLTKDVSSKIIQLEELLIKVVVCSSENDQKLAV